MNQYTGTAKGKQEIPHKKRNGRNHMPAESNMKYDHHNKFNQHAKYKFKSILIHQADKQDVLWHINSGYDTFITFDYGDAGLDHPAEKIPHQDSQK